MNCPVCEADNREGAHFCRMCGVKFPAANMTEGPLAEEVREPAPEDPVSDTEMDAPEAPAEEPLPGAESVQAEPQKMGSETGPADTPLAGPATETGAAETSAAETEALLETPALTETAEPPVWEVDSQSGVSLEGPAVERAPADETPAQSAPESEEMVTASGDSAVEPEMAGATVEEKAGDAEEGTPGQPEAQVTAELSEPGAPGAAPPGLLIADRFELIEMLDTAENEILYRAEDLNGCLQCDFEGNAPDDPFCGHCGAALEQRPSVHLLETPDPEGEPSGGQEVASRLTHEDRTFLLLAEKAAEPEAQRAPESLRLLVGHSTHVGQLRGLNEDSLVVMTLAPTFESETRPVLGLFAVADGMGGHQGGEVASRLALQVLASRVLESITLPELADQPASEEVVVEFLRQATVAANDAVFLARQKRENDMGTTLTAAFVRDHQLFLAHVGDCRAYRWNAGGLQQLTTDHSLVASMIASGQAEPDEIYTHPHRSVIHRCIGDQPLVEVDAEVLSLAPGDRIIVCSDGLWEMVRSEGIEDVMLQEPNPQAACELLVSHANLAGGDDNVSVIVVQIET